MWGGMAPNSYTSLRVTCRQLYTLLEDRTPYILDEETLDYTRENL